MPLPPGKQKPKVAMLRHRAINHQRGISPSPSPLLISHILSFRHTKVMMPLEWLILRQSEWGFVCLCNDCADEQRKDLHLLSSLGIVMKITMTDDDKDTNHTNKEKSDCSKLEMIMMMIL